MANKHKKIDPEKLLEKALEYCDECINGVNGNKADRHIPTIGYFLLHWLRRNDFEFYKRSQFYEAKNDPAHPLSDTIKEIDRLFSELATDIVANEGKGIFYAKNRLGMSDKIESRVIEQPLFPEEK